MSAVDEIQAAIEKLAELKAESTQPTGATSWYQGRDSWRYETSGEVYSGPDEFTEGSTDIIYGIEPTDAELIVTLHRTIDAQLAILQTEMAFRELGFRDGDPGSVSDNALTLARAINGGA